ncbi:Pycsar system effector family protein [Flavobacterium sp.]|uniref:Pycsar system effector family protein n=1 Tax=Flavobacterium sp. TaxID=239 RepID=UPI0039E375F4
MDIIQKAEETVFALFKDKLSPAYTYHNFNHTLRVVNAVTKLMEKENVTKLEETALLLAAWFHDTGYIEGSDKHEERSVVFLKDFAKKETIDSETLSLAEDLIRVTEFCKAPNSKAESIIRDADTSHFAEESYLSICELLREEWRQISGKNYTDLEWAVENRNMLANSHRYYTDYAKRKWQPLKDKNIGLIQEQIKLLEADAIKNAGKKKKADKADTPERGIETMFRVTLNNHTQLSQIADSKANILLSVNAIIISIALSTLIPKLDSPGNIHLVIPTFIMIMFSVVSIIFAILSTKPKVTRGSFTRKEIGEKGINLLFFGNFYKMPVDEYVWAMNEMMKDKEYLYDSMIKDLYYLGIVLNRKYKMLRITYNVFMTGIIVSVIAFVLAFRSVTA